MSIFTSKNKEEYSIAIVKKYLYNNNYKLIGQNIRWKKSQIDLLAYDHNIYVAIEVKYRSSWNYINPTTNQIKKITEYLLHHYFDQFIRIDYIIVFNRKIYHYQDINEDLTNNNCIVTSY